MTEKPIALCEATLHRGLRGVALPGYDRSPVSASIVHFGVGGFHRAHQAMYLDRLLAGDGDRRWGCAGSACCSPTARWPTRWALRTTSARSPSGARRGLR